MELVWTRQSLDQNFEKHNWIASQPTRHDQFRSFRARLSHCLLVWDVLHAEAGRAILVSGFRPALRTADESAQDMVDVHCWDRSNPLIPVRAFRDAVLGHARFLG